MSNTDEPRNKDESGGFKVSDRRQFTADGAPVEGLKAEAPPSEEAGDSGNRSELRDDQEEAQGGAKSIDFSSFVLSLATTAMAHLGEVPDPTTGATSENLDAAQQMIDILSLLGEKTKGNLEADEGRLLEGLLYELRIKFLKKTKKITL